MSACNYLLEGRWRRQLCCALLFGFVICLPVASQGQGTIRTLVGFEGPPVIPPASSYSIDGYAESGVSFQPMVRYISRVTPGNERRPHNGTTYLSSAIGDTLAFGFFSQAAFDLIAIDLAEYITLFPTPLEVRFVGYRQDGGIVETSLFTDGIIDGMGPLADFETFTFDKEFRDLQRVEITSYGWSIDNLVLFRNIPEPTALALTAVGLVLVIPRLFRQLK